MTKATKVRKIKEAYKIIKEMFEKLEKKKIHIRPSHHLTINMIMDYGCFVPDFPNTSIIECIEILENMK